MLPIGSIGIPRVPVRESRETKRLFGIRSFKCLIGPLKGLIRPFKDLIRPFKDLIRPPLPLKGPYKALKGPYKAPEVRLEIS